MAELPMNPLEIPLIISEICKYLEPEELLKCSEVNRSWKKEARKELVKTKFIATVKNGRACTELLRLNGTVRDMKYPFNGLYLSLKSCFHICIGGFERASETYSDILSKMGFKYLRIKWRDNFVGDRCPAVGLLRIILESKSESLVHLYIEELHPRAVMYDPALALQRRLYFPSLKRLQFSHDEEPVFLPEKLVEDLVRAAPNLEALEMMVEPDVIRFLEEDRYKILKRLHFSDRLAENDDFYQRFALMNPKLTELCACSDWLFDDRESFQRILLSSKETLKTVGLNSIAMMMVKQLNMGPFPGVTKVKIGVPHIDERTKTLLRRFNFSAVFPAAQNVNLYISMLETDFLEDLPVVPVPEDLLVDVDGPEDFAVVDDGSEVVIFDYPPSPENTALIASVQIFGSLRGSPNPFQSIGQIFANVTSLDINVLENCKISYREIWENFPKLQRLRVTDVNLYKYANFDAEFCGITTQEADILLPRNRAFLKRVHVVPTYACITTMADLREVEIVFHYLPKVAQPYKYFLFLSDVTGWVALRRTPKLKLRLKCHYGGDTKLLNHLKDFAEVTAEECEHFIRIGPTL